MVKRSQIFILHFPSVINPKSTRINQRNLIWKALLEGMKGQMYT